VPHVGAVWPLGRTHVVALEQQPSAHERSSQNEPPAQKPPTQLAPTGHASQRAPLTPQTAVFCDVRGKQRLPTQQPSHVRKLQGNASHWPARHHCPAPHCVHVEVVAPQLAFVWNVGTNSMT
jgi:hypothetical protein